MILEKYIDKHNVINVWSSSQKANKNFGFKRGFIVIGNHYSADVCEWLQTSHN